MTTVIADRGYAALESGCQVLCSGDLQHEQGIESFTIIDPFR